MLFRCDASLQIGSGHVIRCRTLARELRRRGAEITFLCRRQPGDLIELLEQEFQVLSLPEQQLMPCEGLEGRNLYGAWLGCSQQQDAADCLAALEQAGSSGVQWLVVDHYGLDASWEGAMREGLGSEPPPQLLVIDDLADRSHICDLLLDQNFFGEATEQRYQGFVPPQCRQLLGPHYALLGPEYALLHPLVPPRTELRRVLVFFGGVDHDNLTGRTLEALIDPELAHLAVDVVIGRQSPHRPAVEDIVARRPQTNLFELLSSLAGLIARADLAIGAGGSTSWERIALRLPTLVVICGLDQAPIANALDKLGNIQLLGEKETVTLDDIRFALIGRIATFLEVREQPPALTDGFGAPRLAMAMLGIQSAISLRPAGAGDEALLLRWANDPQVRASSFSPNLIARLDHHNWFLQGLADPNRLLLIATAADGCPIGQIRFDRQPLPTHDGSAEAIVDVSLDSCVRGFGLSAELVRLGLQAMEQTWGSEIEAVAKVLKSNRASNACFNRAGFVQEPVSPAAPSVRPMNCWRCRPAASPSSAIVTAGSIATCQT